MLYLLLKDNGKIVLKKLFIMKFDKIYAFTLAEVLITLGIIGVVAALTIPILMTNTQDAEFKNKLEKEYSVLNQAQQQLALDAGGKFADAISSCSTNACVEGQFAAKLSYVKECTISSDCLNTSQVKYLNGGSAVAAPFITTVNNANNGLILKDGASLAFWTDSYNCTADSDGDCGWLILDVNGLLSPNRFGKDIYFFRFFATSIKPLSISEVGDDCISNGVGYTCAYRYLRGQDVN